MQFIHKKFIRKLINILLINIINYLVLCVQYVDFGII